MVTWWENRQRKHVIKTYSIVKGFAEWHMSITRMNFFFKTRARDWLQVVFAWLLLHFTSIKCLCNVWKGLKMHLHVIDWIMVGNGDRKSTEMEWKTKKWRIAIIYEKRFFRRFLSYFSLLLAHVSVLFSFSLHVILMTGNIPSFQLWLLKDLISFV